MKYLRGLSNRIWAYFSMFMNGSASVVNHLVWFLICLGIMSFLIGSVFIPVFGTGYYATISRRVVAFVSGLALYIIWIFDDLNEPVSDGGENP